MYDFHIHSDFSNDAEFSMEVIAEAAVQQGLEEICFTDHVDYDYADPSIEFDIDHVRYVAEIQRLQRKYKGQLRIRHGLELGLQPHVLDQCSQLVKREQPDFVIGSLHTCCRQDLYRGDYYLQRTPEQSWEHYLDEAIAIAKSYRDYCVLGHLDILRRYNTATAQLPIDPYKEQFMELFRILVDTGKGIEVNTSGLRGHLESPLPSYDILKWYHEAGGQIVTLGSDSHGPDYLASHFEEVKEQLKSIGFRFTCSFVDMKPIYHPL